MIDSRQLTRILDSKPAKTTEFVYQAIVLSLAAHILILAFIYLTNGPQGTSNQEEDPESIEELNLAFFKEEELEPPVDELPSTMSEEVRNLLASTESKTTKERVSYAKKSKEQIAEEVLKDLQDFEASEKSKLKEGRPVTPKDEKKAPNTKEDKTEKEDYDWVQNPSDKSYEGHVAASYDLAGRDPLTSPKPLYRCKSSGRVVVKIEVDQTGKVLAAVIDESLSVMNDCLRDESQKYAMKWKFNYKTEAPKKQQGTITFDFSAQ